MRISSVIYDLKKFSVTPLSLVFLSLLIFQEVHSTDDEFETQESPLKLCSQSQKIKIQQCSLADLPDEMIENMMSYLTGNQVMALLSVSKNFQKCALRAFKHGSYTLYVDAYQYDGTNISSFIRDAKGVELRYALYNLDFLKKLGFQGSCWQSLSLDQQCWSAKTLKPIEKILSNNLQITAISLRLNSLNNKTLRALSKRLGALPLTKLTMIYEGRASCNTASDYVLDELSETLMSKKLTSITLKDMSLPRLDLRASWPHLISCSIEYLDQSIDDQVFLFVPAPYITLPLRHLAFVNAGLGPWHGEALKRLLSQSPDLCTLNLSGNYFSDALIAQCIKVLFKNPIQKVILDGLDLEEETDQALSQTVPGWPIETLSVCDTGDFEPNFLEKIQMHPKLRYVLLTGNMVWSDLAVKALSTLLTNPHRLERIEFSWRFLDDEQKDVLRAGLRETSILKVRLPKDLFSGPDRKEKYESYVRELIDVRLQRNIIGQEMTLEGLYNLSTIKKMLRPVSSMLIKQDHSLKSEARLLLRFLDVKESPIAYQAVKKLHLPSAMSVMFAH